MPRKPSSQLTPLELEIMKVLWETGSANVQEVQGRLGRDLAYTTVQTVLNILHRKGKVKRVLKAKAYFYRPVVSRPQVVRQAVGDLIDRLFSGSAESLVMSLVETRQLTPEKLLRLKQILEDGAQNEQDQ